MVIPTPENPDSSELKDPEGLLMVKVLPPQSMRLREVARKNRLSYSAVFRLALDAGLPAVIAGLEKMKPVEPAKKGVRK